LIKTYHKKHHF